jgi:hypothetical protein
MTMNGRALRRAIAAVALAASTVVGGLAFTQSPADARPRECRNASAFMLDMFDVWAAVALEFGFDAPVTQYYSSLLDDAIVEYMLAC